MARTRIGIGIWAGEEAITCYAEEGIILVNPHKLVIAMKKHFSGYIQRLKNPDEIALRKGFEARFDREENE